MLVRAYLKARGHGISEPAEFEGYSEKNIPKECISELYAFQTKNLRLTRYDEWEEPL